MDEPGPTRDWSRESGVIAEAIRAGKIDSELHRLANAINDRHGELARLRRARALAGLHVGGRVMIGATAQPKYLRGQTGEVHEIDGDMAVVCLDTPVGRFTSGHVRCPAELLVPDGT